MKKLICALTALALFVAPAWAGDDDDVVEEGVDLRPFVSIDTNDIVNKTDQPAANFRSMIDRLNNALTGSRQYRVVDMNDMAEALKKNDEMVLAADAKKYDGFETPGYTIHMTISTYGITTTTEFKPLYNKYKQIELAKIELIVRVTDRKGETVQSKDITARSSGETSANSNLREQVLQDACKKACDGIVAALIEMTPFYIFEIEDGEISIAVGKPTVKIGQILRVMKLGKAKTHPVTKEIIRSEKEVARLQVVSATDEVCLTKVLKGKDKLPDEDDEDSYMKYRVRFLDPDEKTLPPVPPTEPDPAVSPF